MKKSQNLIKSLTLASLFVFIGGSYLAHGEEDSASRMVSIDEYTLSGSGHFLRDYSPVDADGNIHVVIEIPAGTNAKWEVDKESGDLAWEFKHGKPRVVAYLGYPGNYGMVPRTLLPEELGGDGDPLDVIVLGSAVPRGSVISVRPIGVLKLLDGGEQDDKIIAVVPETALGQVHSLEELQKKFHGITDIVEVWFSNYKGPGKLESLGYKDVEAAKEVIQAAIQAYENRDEGGKKSALRSEESE